MRAALPLAVLLLAPSAHAHIKLSAPANFQQTNTLGDPQKTAPCGGAGTATNAVTTVEAGSQLTVQWTETIGHPGHFRISIAPDPADFVTPTAVVMNNDCKSAPIETSPVLPTIVDGLFPRTSAVSGTQHSTTITVPSAPCDRCTLQLVQFMSAHTPPCFYFQCATLRIVAPDAGASSDAGAGDAGPPPDAGTTQPGDDAGVDDHPEPTVVGCGCGAGAWPAAPLLLAALRRRRR